MSEAGQDEVPVSKNNTYHAVQKRCPEHFKVVRAQTERFRESSIPSMIKLLNLPQSVSNQRL